ncbi:MAG TPA: hypothetical protein VFB58_11285 [Chloroflexota bacterium]|nr:hypothetical protein [Chloroflexota bacterium]
MAAKDGLLGLARGDERRHGECDVPVSGPAEDAVGFVPRVVIGR